ncbi:type II toxin-antitoxin system PemK/MazF family toxin [soil metagenome]
MVVLVNLDPTIGVEIKKTRPCLIISPDAANKHLQTVIIAPLATSQRNIPTRLLSNFNGQPGELCFDQMKAIDKVRILKIIGWLEEHEKINVTRLLVTMFNEI